MDYATIITAGTNAIDGVGPAILAVGAGIVGLAGVALAVRWIKASFF